MHWKYSGVCKKLRETENWPGTEQPLLNAAWMEPLYFRLPKLHSWRTMILRKLADLLPSKSVKVFFLDCAFELSIIVQRVIHNSRRSICPCTAKHDINSSFDRWRRQGRRKTHPQSPTSVANDPDGLLSTMQMRLYAFFLPISPFDPICLLFREDQ